MTRVAVVAAALGAVAWHARPAQAGSCHGSDGDGGSSDTSSSSSSSSSSSVHVSTDIWEEPPCVETTDILGRRQCGGFGGWAMPAGLPALSLEVGTSVRTFDLGSRAFSGTIDHGTEGSYAYRMVGGGDSTAPATALGIDFRMIGGRRAYGGLEASVGGIAADERAMQMSVDTDTGATLAPTVQVHFLTGAVAGARWSTGSLSLSGEVFAGARMIQVELDSHYGACATTDYARDWSPMLEPRARADLWLTPWVTLGAFAGTDLLEPGSRTLGVMFGAHTRAFDATR